MALMTWEPLREIEDLLDRYGRGLGLPLMRPGERLLNGEWAPRVDISESEAQFQIHAELPGVKKEDVSVKVSDGVLTLEGERHIEREEKGWRQHRIERSHGRFSRSFTLPANVDAEHLRAHYQDGILEVELPKTPAAPATAMEVPVD